MSAGRGQGQRHPAPLTNQSKGDTVANRKRATSGKPGKRTVRTTFNPGTSIEVGDAEYLDLKRQGLIHEGEVPAVGNTDAATGDVDDNNRPLGLAGGNTEGGAS